jgi:hypothetical protein
MRSLNVISLPSSCTVVLELTQLLTEMSTKNFPEANKHGRCIRLTISLQSVSLLSRKYEIIDISQSYRPPQPVTGIALLLLYFTRNLMNRG